MERHVTLVIIAGALVATLLSLSIGLRQSVWFDEAYSIQLAKQSVSQLLALTAVDTHPPLYYLILKAWASIFGWSELALRSLSLVAFGGAVATGALLVKRMFGARIALVALGVMVVSPFLLRYGFEIRMYALASFIGVVATYVLVLAVEMKASAARWRLYALYALLVAAGMYTLYYMAMLWLAHVAWLVWREWRGRRSVKSLLQTPWLIAYGAAAALFLPWLPVLAQQMRGGALTSVAQPMTLDNLMSIISFYTVYQPVWRLGPFLSVLVVGAIILIGWLTARTLRLVTDAQRSYLVLLMFYTLVPIAFLTLVGFFRPMYLERYMSHVAIGGSLLLGVMIGTVYPHVRRGKRWLIGLLLAIFLVGTSTLIGIGNFNFQRLLSPSMNQVANRIVSCTGGSRVLAADPYAAIELNYYLPSCPVYFYGDVERFTGGYAPLNDTDDLQVSDLAKGLDSVETLYLVYYDQPGFEVPEQYSLAERSIFGPLVLERFSAERRD
jgi:uncharacterized membrane protein